jgi:glutamine---fructose-6-phosphate transaminase (isomerizing)
MLDSQEAKATLMFAEASEAGDAVERLFETNRAALQRIAEHLRAAPPSVAITCARGSSDHAATYGKYLIETLLGVPTSSAALSTASLFGAPVVTKGALCIAISQSGRSPDLLRSVETLKAAGAYVVALVNDPDGPLVALADEPLMLSAGPERSVAATKSYIASLAGLAALVGAWADDAALRGALNDLPARLRRAFALDWLSELPVLAGARNLFVIGRGYSFAVAQEAALKLKETCGLHAEAFSSAEVRHGPMAIVGEGFPLLAFATSDTAGDDVRQVATEFAARGAHVGLCDPRGSGALEALPDHPAIEPILMIQSFYRLANAVSLARGLEPDTPPHLSKVTRTV